MSKRSAVHAVPVISTPAIATAGYAVGASGARFVIYLFGKKISLYFNFPHPPAIATAGYAVEASDARLYFFSFLAKKSLDFPHPQGAIGGQAPATIAAPATAVAYTGYFSSLVLVGS